MANYSKATKQEIQKRREKLRTLMAKGFNRPAKLWNIQEVQDMYHTYHSPYNNLKFDMLQIRKENVKYLNSGLMNEALGDFVSSLEDHLIQCNKDLVKLGGNAKVGMAKHIWEVQISIAKAKGIDPEKVEINQVKVNIENKIAPTNGGTNVKIPKEIIKQFGDFMASQRRPNHLADGTPETSE